MHPRVAGRQREVPPRGTDYTYNSRVRWALRYRKHAGLVAATGRGHLRTTQRRRFRVSSARAHQILSVSYRSLSRPLARLTEEEAQELLEFCELRAYPPCRRPAIERGTRLFVPAGEMTLALAVPTSIGSIPPSSLAIGRLTWTRRRSAASQSQFRRSLG